MKSYSKHWLSSKQPKKQRKYVHNAPLHRKKNLISANLSKELRKKYKRRNFPLRKGDVVKLMRGQFKKHAGKVENINLKKLRVFVEGVNVVKRDGSKSMYPLHPSNLQIIELNLDDKLRRMKLEGKK